jgi:hypothetical protein
MLTPAAVIVILKIAVSAVTVLLVASLLALVCRRPRLHGQINRVFFALTMSTVLLFEGIIRLVNPELTSGFSPEQREALTIHLAFAIPSAVLLPVMLYTGVRRRKRLHVTIAFGFLALWAGTFVTGVFFIPHSFEPTP